MCFDECTACSCEKTALKSMQMSMRWAERSREAFGYKEGRSLFGIQQGSVFPEQREESAEALENWQFMQLVAWPWERDKKRCLKF